MVDKTLVAQPSCMAPPRIESRIDLAGMAGFCCLETDSDGRPCVWEMSYECDCGAQWHDRHSCGCDDACPDCGSDVAPWAMTWIGPTAPHLVALWQSLPEG